ncbi:MAG: amidohydrolase family protein [Hyphomicrobiales bacterium]|nr:amidohydrolase family protein [Hyphomicrobiales bacterium]
MRVTGRDPATGEGVTVEIDAGRIVAIASCQAPDAPFIAPGLVDLQVNGFHGIDLNDGAVTPGKVIELVAHLHKVGVTTFLPTLITASKEALIAGLVAIAEARTVSPGAAHAIPFVHVEGPFIAPEDGPRGAHPAEHVRPPDVQELAEWQAASGGLVGMITLSPHHAGASGFIRHATDQGIHVAIGHTAATPAQIEGAVTAGARMSTHLGNGAAAMLPRHPNMIWSQLAEDRLTATFIADGFHLPAETFKAMLRSKGLERAVLVSDLTALGGLPAGTYEQAVGGRVELSAEGRISVAGTPYLAGAALPLCRNVAIAARMAGLSLAESLSLATVNPGRFAAGRGRLAVGHPADLILFDWTPGSELLDIVATFAAAEQVFRAAGPAA